MSDVTVITNRKLCREDFLARIEKIAGAQPHAIVLREKDLTEEEYKELAIKTLNICSRYGTTCILHAYTDVAIELGVKAVHLPLNVLKTLTPTERKRFTTLGASCHSVSDAIKAQDLGATYVTAGHVFETDCKKGLPGRGIEFLKEICRSVTVPVLAIGGISEKNAEAVRRSGASGVCVMSGAMTCDDVVGYLSRFEERKNEIQ